MLRIEDGAFCSWYCLIKDLYLNHLNYRENALSRSFFIFFIKCEPLKRYGGIHINSKGKINM